MEFDNELIFCFGEIATFKVRSQVVDPAKSATLATSKKASGFRK